MMFPFFPYYRRRNYNYTPNNSNFSHSINPNTYPINNQFSNNSHSNNFSENCCDNNTCLNQKKEDKIFEIFGLNFHFDDLLLIGLLFLLYQDDCDDYYLFIILFLLLLSK